MTSGNVQNIQFNHAAVKQTAIVIQQLQNQKENLAPKPRLSAQDRKALKGNSVEGDVAGLFLGELVFAGAAALLFDDNMISMFGRAVPVNGFAEVAAEVTEEVLEDSFEKKQREFDKKKAEELAEKRRMMAAEQKDRAAARSKQSMIEMIIMMLMMMLAMNMTYAMVYQMQTLASSNKNDKAMLFTRNKDFMRQAANDVTPQNYNRGFMPRLAM